VVKDGQPLFDVNGGDASPRLTAGPGGQLTWGFILQLKRAEAP
jgi:hypothetical protein